LLHKKLPIVPLACISILLAVGILTACTTSKSTPNIVTSSFELAQYEIANTIETEPKSDKSNTSATSKESSVQSDVQGFFEKTKDEELCNLFRYAAAMGFGVPFDEYQGFNSPTEIDSQGLLNFFLLAANEKDFYDKTSNQYVITVDKIKLFLNSFFNEFTFLPEKIEQFKDNYDADKQEFHLSVFSPMAGPINVNIDDKIDNKDGTGTINATYKFDNKTYAQASLLVRINNGKTLFQSYNVNHNKQTAEVDEMPANNEK